MNCMGSGNCKVVFVGREDELGDGFVNRCFKDLGGISTFQRAPSWPLDIPYNYHPAPQCCR